VVTGVETSCFPADFTLHPNYPNPFNAATEIRYRLPEATDVSLRIYNIAGQMVRTLVQARQPAGFHAAAWDGTDDGRRAVASGIYFCRLQAGRAAETIKMALVR
jgi:flagellar hook assembly protein FlgD